MVFIYLMMSKCLTNFEIYDIKHFEDPEVMNKFILKRGDTPMTF